MLTRVGFSVTFELQLRELSFGGELKVRDDLSDA